MNTTINKWQDLLEQYQDVLNYSFNEPSIGFAGLIEKNPSYLTLKDPMEIEYQGIKLCLVTRD